MPNRWRRFGISLSTIRHIVDSDSLHLSHVPLLVPAVCLVAGILVGNCWHLPLVVTFAAFVAAIGAGWLLAGRGVVQQYAVFACMFLLGMLVSPGERAPLPEGVWMEAVVVGPPSEKPQTMAVAVTLPAYGETRRCYLLKSARSRQLQIGDGIVIRLTEKPFLRDIDWQKGGEAFRQLTTLQRARLRCVIWRERLLSRYRSLQIDDDGDDYAVLAAMTLGSKTALTADLRDTYSVTGASHVLALSGLHLGIIYLLLTRLLFIRRRWLEPLIVVPALWAFAFLTGLSPSVVRAATMISIYAVFACRGKRRPSLNVLCFTAIVMLTVDPQSLFDVGFQLSFAAVFSIALFMPLLDRLPIAYRLQGSCIGRWLWSLVAVSLTAQAGVAPLIAYYFGRLPTYFLLTNIVVLPAATLILYGGLLTLLIPWPPIGQATLWIVGVMNDALTFLSHLPMASIDGLHPSVVQTILLYLLLGVLYLIMVRCLPRDMILPYQRRRRT